MTIKGFPSHRRIDLTGATKGKLTVLGVDKDKSTPKALFWSCKCECGNTTSIRASSLNNTKNPTSSCGCLKKTHFIDHTGREYNNIKVVEYIGKDKSKNNIYNFQCFCGNIFTQQISDIRSAKIRSCGCRLNSKQYDNFLDNPYKSIIKMLYKNYRSDAKSRGYEFNITLEYFVKLIETECFYCGVKSSNSRPATPKGTYKVKNYTYNGIDRMDNNLGYTVDNCVTCCKSCNISKHTLTYDYFVDRAYKLVERNEKRKLLKILNNFIDNLK